MIRTCSGGGLSAASSSQMEQSCRGHDMYDVVVEMYDVVLVLAFS